MQWINVNEDYLDFLRKSEPKIPHTNYENKYKPFFGVLFETNWSEKRNDSYSGDLGWTGSSRKTVFCAAIRR